MASPLLFFGALILGLSVPSAAPTEVVVAAVLPEHNLRHPGAWPRVRPALDLALEALEPQLRPAGLSVRTVFASSDEGGTCSWTLAEKNVIQLKASQDPDVLLGLGCDDPRTRVRYLAEDWGLPFLSAGDYEYTGSWTTVYAGPAGSDFRVFQTLLDQHFNWTASSVLAFPHKGHQQDFHRFPFMLPPDLIQGGSHRSWAPHGLDEEPNEVLQFIRASAHVAYLQGSPETLQQTMRLAQAQNMTNGDYVFIYLDILGEILEAVGHREAAKPWQSKEGRDAGGLREAFQTVLIITAHQPQTPEYRHFQSELILRAQRDFGVALNDSQHKNLVAGCFHDVLLLYIRALNETLREGRTKRDTRRILKKMRNLKIQGVTGTVSLDNNNERDVDFDLWSMADGESGRYEVVAHYVGSGERIKWLGPIHWKKGCPPLNNLPCILNRTETPYDEDMSSKGRAGEKF